MRTLASIFLAAALIATSPTATAPKPKPEHCIDRLPYTGGPVRSSSSRGKKYPKVMIGVSPRSFGRFLFGPELPGLGACMHKHEV